MLVEGKTLEPGSRSKLPGIPLNVEIVPVKNNSRDIATVGRSDNDAFYYDPYGTEYIKGLLEDPKVRMHRAVADGKTVGHTILYLGWDGHGDSAVDQPGKSYLDTIAVRYAMQGRHVGDQLLLNVLSMCMDSSVASCVLCVRQNNEPAIRFYEKYGFTKTGETETELYKALAGYGEEYSTGAYMKLDLTTPGFKRRYEENRQKIENLFSVSSPADVSDTNPAFHY